MRQTVQVVHGALEIGQHRPHFVSAVTQVLGHYFVSIADAVNETVVVSLNLLKNVQ